MKGGVLVSMPVNARHTPGGSNVEQTPRGHSGSVDEGMVFGSGNILDDILARSQRNKEQSPIARKKSVASKTVAKKQTSYALRSNQSNDNDSVTVSNTSDKRNIHTIGETVTTPGKNVRNISAITVSDSPDGKNININLSLTISMPGEEQQKAEIKHAATVKMPSPGQPDDVTRSLNDKTWPVGESSDVKLNSECLANPNHNETKIQTIVISDTDNEEQGVGVTPTIHTANSENSQGNSVKINASELTSKPEVITLSSPEKLCNSTLKMSSISADTDKQIIKPSNSSRNTLNVSFKPDTDNQRSKNALKSIDNSKNETDMNRVTITPDTDEKSPNDVKNQVNKVIKKQDSAIQLNNDIKPDLAETHDISSKVVKEGNTDQDETDIKPEPLSISCDKLVINIKSECETVNHDSDKKAQMNPEKTDEQRDVNESKPGIKPDKKAQTNFKKTNEQLNVHKNKPDVKRDAKPDMATDGTGKESKATQCTTDIKPDPNKAITSKDNDKGDIKPVKVQTVSPSCEAVLDTECNPCGEGVFVSTPKKDADKLENIHVESLDTELHQGNEELKEDPPQQSPCSPIGDLVIDMDSDDELSTRLRRRAKKRVRYSSQTSESSSEGPQVSSFDWIRNLSEKMKKCVEENETVQGIVRSSPLTSGHNHHHINTNIVPPYIIQSQQ